MTLNEKRATSLGIACTLLFACVVYAFQLGPTWGVNLASFAVWVFVFIYSTGTCARLFKEEPDKPDPRPALPVRLLSWSIQGAIVTVLAAGGSYFLAGLFLLMFLLWKGLNDHARKYWSDKADTE